MSTLLVSNAFLTEVCDLDNENPTRSFPRESLFFPWFKTGIQGRLFPTNRLTFR